MTHVNTTPAQPTLDDAHARALRALAALIIPASAEFGVPGADDDAIFADLLATSAPNEGELVDGLRALRALAGGDLDALDAVRRLAVAEQFRRTHPAYAAQIESLVVRCYYRDDRVMRAIGMEPRPPFPKGFDVEPGDLSLLAPVIARGRLWREPR